MTFTLLPSNGTGNDDNIHQSLLTKALQKHRDEEERLRLQRNTMYSTNVNWPRGRTPPYVRESYEERQKVAERDLREATPTDELAIFPSEYVSKEWSATEYNRAPKKRKFEDILLVQNAHQTGVQPKRRKKDQLDTRKSKDKSRIQKPVRRRNLGRAQSLHQMQEPHARRASYAKPMPRHEHRILGSTAGTSRRTRRGEDDTELLEQQQKSKGEKNKKRLHMARDARPHQFHNSHPSLTRSKTRKLRNNGVAVEFQIL